MAFVPYYNRVKSYAHKVQTSKTSELLRIILIDDKNRRETLLMTSTYHTLVGKCPNYKDVADCWHYRTQRDIIAQHIKELNCDIKYVNIYSHSLYEGDHLMRRYEIIDINKMKFKRIKIFNSTLL